MNNCNKKAHTIHVRKLFTTATSYKIVADRFHLYLGASLTLQCKNYPGQRKCSFLVLEYMFCRILFGNISEQFLECSFAETAYIEYELILRFGRYNHIS